MITRYFTFIKADLESVGNAIVSMKEARHIVQKTTAPLKIDLSYVNCGIINKMALWSISENQTAMYGNQSDGFYTTCYVLNLRYGYDVTQICLTLDPEIKIDDEVYDMRLFCHIGKEHEKRLVRVMQDPRWDFYEIGEPFPFEQTEKYKERIKKKRLTNDMILDYAEAMGYDVRNPDFWKSDNATYLEWSDIPVAKQK